MLLLLCRAIVPVIFVLSLSLFQGPLYIVQYSSKCCFVLLLPSNHSCSCYLRILLFRLFLIYCIAFMLGFFLYSRDVAFVLSFYQATILSYVAFGFFFVLFERPFLIILVLLLGFFLPLQRQASFFINVTFWGFLSI